MFTNSFLDNLIFIIAILGNLLIAFFVISQKQRKRENSVFFFFSLSLTGWLITLSLFYNILEESWLLLVGRLNFAFMIITVYFLYRFVDIFPAKIFKSRLLTNLALSVETVSLFLITVFTPWIDKNEIAQGNYRETVWGNLYFLFVIHFLFHILLSVVILFVKYKKFAGLKKQQIRYVIWAISSSAFLGCATNIIAPFFGFHDISKIGPLAIFFLIALIAYAILKHRFLDIRIVIRQSIVYGLSLGSVIAITVSSVLGVAYFAKINVNYWTLTFGLILGTLLFDPIKRSFQFFANKYLFTSLYNYQATIRALSQELTTTIDFEKIISYLNQIMQETMHVEKMAVLIKDQNNAHYNAHKIFGFAKKEAELWPIFNLITEYLKENQYLIAQEEIENGARYGEREAKLAKTMREENLALALPLVRAKKMIGVIILGEKISADSYSKQDIELLEVLANQASIAIENALLYKEVRDFTLHLKEKVAEQTEDIKKLYAVKNDFLHIVSHQLRTPLTALNGLISLWTDKDYEAQTKEEKDKIKERVKISCDRLSDVTNRMLDTLNFEKGRIILKLEKIDLGKNMQEIAQMLRPNFEKGGLYLKFKPLEKSFFIFADPKYLSQVFQNLIDNAEKYTKEGGLTIQIRKSLKEAKIIFKDTGIGLDAKEKKYALREKFFRGQGAQEQYTGGTGLGLYLVKQIIDAHRGKIEVNSEGRDQGTEFIVTLPIN